jgi:hypothetical protein
MDGWPSMVILSDVYLYIYYVARSDTKLAEKLDSMTRDHAIRLAVSHLKGAERDKMIQRLCEHPKQITPSVMRQFDTVRESRKYRTTPKTINWAFRITPEEYLDLQSRAKRAGVSTTRYVRSCLWT